MIYMLFVFLAALSSAAICFVGARKGVVYTGEKSKIYKKCEENIKPFEGKTLILITIICFVVSIAMQISLYKNTSVVNFIKLYGLYLIVVSAGLIDFKCRIIPNTLIICGLIFRVGIYIYEIISIDSIRQVVINDLIGFTIGFVFLAVVSLVSKGSLGFGDAKLFGVIGLTSGSFCTYSTLLISLIISLIFSLINIIGKKMSRKDAFPFGPCITVGYIIAVLLTSY